MSNFNSLRKRGMPVPCLNAKEYEHKRDAESLRAMKVNGFLDKAIKTFNEYTYEKADKIRYVGSNVRVTARNMPYLYRCVEKACEILNISEIPDTYVTESPWLNSFTSGFTHPIICINNALIDCFTHEEFMFIIGHELGHIKSEHCQYTAIGKMIKSGVQKGVSLIPVVGQIIEQIVAPGQDYLFYDWQRKSELTADRAGLLACQNLRAAISALAKIGGYPRKAYHRIDVNGFLEQAWYFEDMGQETSNKIADFLLTLEKTHPWTVQRAKELMTWVQSGEYSRVLLRGSAWLKEEAERLSSASQKATDQYGKKQTSAEKAGESEKPRAEKAALKKQKRAEKAREVMESAVSLEQAVRKTYRELSEAQIAKHTKKTIGRLKWDTAKA